MIRYKENINSHIIDKCCFHLHILHCCMSKLVGFVILWRHKSNMNQNLQNKWHISFHMVNIRINRQLHNIHHYISKGSLIWFRVSKFLRHIHQLIQSKCYI
jgi:hypothetical protein